MLFPSIFAWFLCRLLVISPVSFPTRDVCASFRLITIVLPFFIESASKIFFICVFAFIKSSKVINSFSLFTFGWIVISSFLIKLYWSYLSWKLSSVSSFILNSLSFSFPLLIFNRLYILECILFAFISISLLVMIFLAVDVISEASGRVSFLDNSIHFLFAYLYQIFNWSF